MSTPLRGTDVTSSESTETGLGSLIMLLEMRPPTLDGVISTLVAGPLLQSSFRHLI
jgi:hypothetical protein